MPKITITEIDQTTPGVIADSNEIVYIPGLVDMSNFTTEKAIANALPVNVPTLFTNLRDFETKCGTHGFIYPTNQTLNPNTGAFAAAAMPEDGYIITAGTTDPSYVMAKELLSAGLPVLYERINSDDAAITLDLVYTALKTIYTDSSVLSLTDMGNYSFKYLTSGGYPSFEFSGGTLVDSMLEVASKRGDCIALIDHTNNPGRTIDTTENSGSVFASVNTGDSFNTKGSYAAMFTPWCGYNRTTIDVGADGKPYKKTVTSGQDTTVYEVKTNDVMLPASFAYLLSLAKSIKTNASWLAVAGVARGLVPNLSTDGIKVNIPNGVADAMQPRSGQVAINAITNIKPYGQTIWGNRTLKKNSDNLVASSFLNVRSLVCDVRKIAYSAARSLTFEQNTDILWLNFKSKIAPTLDRMQSGYGISGYKILRDTEHEKASEKGTMCAKIVLYPVEAVEDFYITVILSDDEVTVE